jgi:class 3 adenylate cyclase/tetratricopeptide (TPR) repeat protein
LRSGEADRRLAAVAFVDIVGYTILMASDETRTHQRWMTILSEVISPQAEKCRGTLVKSTGDGVLVEFPSAHDAVEWAREVQRQVIPKQVEHDGAAPTIVLRVAVHLGDVMTTDFDVFGDGVNVAARLQRHGVPGGVILSEAVYDLVRGTIGPSARDLGFLRLKNFEKPIRAYSLDPEAQELEGWRPPSHVGLHDLSASPQSPTEGSLVAGQVFAQSNIAMRVPMHFIGRDDALAEIEQAIARNNGRLAITALYGLRGVGKTTLATAYAERHREDYRAIWWIRAQTALSMRADLIAVGVRLGWVRADDKSTVLPEEPTFAAVMERLHHEGEGILLIYDNAIDPDALKPYLPRGGAARVLITSNAHAWRGVAVPVEIRLWPKEIGADYLIARTGRVAERAAAEALSEVLGGLPLAHEQSAAYCERLDISLAEYRKRFEVGPTRMLDDARHAPAEYHDGLTVAKTFALAIDEAAKLHPAAESLIVHAALLAPEPIPLFLFAEAREKLEDALATTLAGDGLDEAVAALRAFALVDRLTIVDERDASITIDAIRLHLLVREVAAARREGGARDQMRRALAAALTAVFPDDGYRNPASWPRCMPLTPHLLASCKTETNDAVASVESAGLLNRAGDYLYGRAAYSGARPLYERALAIREQALGPEHPDTAESLGNLAVLLKTQGDLAGARPLLERALAIREKALGPEHSDTADSLNSLAVLLKTQGDLAGAQPLYERALAINERGLGSEHRETAISLGNLARLLQARDDFPGAQPLFERALAIHEKVLGPEHPHTAESLANLAILLRTQGDLARARPLFERALAIRETALGLDHPDTARSLGNLARLFQAEGNLAGARQLFERSLAIREKVLGPEHPDTAMSLGNLAVLVQAQGDLALVRQ